MSEINSVAHVHENSLAKNKKRRMLRGLPYDVSVLDVTTTIIIIIIILPTFSLM